MYRVRPKSINTKSTDRDIEDGFLQESINLQWRDDAFRPIPERLVSDIDVTGYTNIILHKVSDENQINVLAFSSSAVSLVDDLAFDLAGYLGGSGAAVSGYLTWIGKIVDGVYSAITPVLIPEIINTTGLSFTILNGNVYFMGDGSSDDEQYYLRLQYNDIDEAYEVKDMYAWKSLVPFYPEQSYVNMLIPSDTFNVNTRCGILLIRYTLVLRTGEEVMHTPIYGMGLNGINVSSAAPAKDDIIENIHTLINLDLEFNDEVLLKEQISAINVYATIPYYLTKFPIDVTNNYSAIYAISDDALSGEFQRLSESPFYLVKTINSTDRDKKLLLTVGEFSSDITYDLGDVTNIDISTIAAGAVMPIDNFTHHKLYGEIKSFNGRLLIEKPNTILSLGYIRALAIVQSTQGFESSNINTEDGVFRTIVREVTDNVKLQSNPVSGADLFSRGMISYPDARADEMYIRGLDIPLSFTWRVETRRNNLHNMACSFDMSVIGNGVFISADGPNARASSDYYIQVKHTSTEILVVGASSKSGYVSGNRLQFSEIGEFSVYPASQSYRIGEGNIINVGANNVNPENADMVAPLIVGTSDGVYTINFDPTGTNLISSITRTAPVPYISKEVLQVTDEKLNIYGMIIFVSDKGLMAINNGVIINLTNDFFPEQGNGNFPDPNTVYPNYNALTNSYFGGGNPYVLDDIVKYMKGAIFAYDARRNTIWCSNTTYNFSLVFNIRQKIWGMSTTVFSEKPELFSLITTAQGDIYSRFLIKRTTNNNLLILSGEDPDTEVIYHLLTRPIKLQYPDNYKKLKGLFSRCELFRDVAETGYFSFGAWGKQDHNKKKVSIPITAKSDGSASVYPNNVRQDVPIGWSKGKYKSVVILQGGQTLPDSSIDGIDFDALLVNETRTR